MDVVVLIPGTSTMAASFGNHPHGFYALTEMLRDWVGSVPLTGESAAIGLDSAAVKGGIRVCIVQFAGAALVTPLGTGSSGSLAGDGAELEEEVSWHEDQFLAGPTRKIKAGLLQAASVFAAASPADKTRAAIIVSDGEFSDQADLATARSQLSNLQGVVLLAVGLRRRETATAADAAVEAALGDVVGSAGRAASVQIDEIPGLLDSLCDPNTAWGHALNPSAGAGAHGPCPRHPSRDACVADPGCLFDGKTATCGDTPCVRHCDEALCSTDPDLACAWDTVAGEVGCWRLAACAHGQNATKCRSDPMCQYDEQLAACAPRPCAFATEEECAASATAACEWHSDSASCRPTQCVHATAEPCRADAACQWNPCNGCAAKRCGAELDTMALCTADLHCQWDSHDSACSLKPCALYSGTERCCKAQDRCVWDVTSSPAMCAAHRCSEHDAEPEQCGLIGNGCAYNAQTAECTQLSCQALGQCDCLQEELCGYNARGGFCVGMAYATCPALDVVVLIDGSEAMARAYGRHPVGFVGLVEALKDWVSDLPLAESGDAEHGSDRVRVAFAQVSAGLVTEPPRSVLTGSRTAALAQLEWHLDNFEGAAGAVRVQTALAAALSVFEAAGGDPARKRVLLVLGGSPVADAHDAAAVRDRASLEARGVAVYSAFVANPTHPAAAAAAASVQALASDPSAFVSAALPEVAAAVLAALCDPESAFGASIANETTAIVVCARVSSQASCGILPSCDWDDGRVQCVTSHCTAHCGIQACGEDARQDCVWAENACVRAVGPACAALTGAGACGSEAACEWLAAAAACIRRRCDHSAEAGCLSAGDACVWDSAAGSCAPPPCGFPTPQTCAAHAPCTWVSPRELSAAPELTYAKGQPMLPFDSLFCRVSAECGGAVECDAAVSGVTVWVADGYVRGKDEVTCPECKGLGVTTEWHAASGVMHLAAAGGASVTAAGFAAALRTVQFASASDAFAPRTVAWSFGPGIPGGAASPRLYRYVPCANPPAGCGRAAAAAACAALTFSGSPGSLAAVSSVADADAVERVVSGRAGWIGPLGVDGRWVQDGAGGGEDLAFANWLPGEPATSVSAAAYATADGGWVALNATGSLGKGAVCEWPGPQCAGSAGSAALAAASCQPAKGCGQTAFKVPCQADAACRWVPAAASGVAETCQAQPCAWYPSELACRGDAACVWSIDDPPGVCTRNPCFAQGTREKCESVSGRVWCAWSGGACSPAACSRLDSCECKLRGQCFVRADAACVSAEAALCPAMDVAVAFSGVAGLGRAFGRRPHGFYAMLAMLGDWAAALPPDGTVRLSFSQFSGAAGILAASSEQAPGAARQLAWHADRFVSGSTSFVSPALTAAAVALGEGVSARKRVVLVVGFGSLDDSAEALAAGVVGLNAMAAARLCVVLRRAPVATQTDEADRKTWLPAVSPPAGLSLQASALEQLPALLSSLCNPNAPFGKVVLGEKTPAGTPPRVVPCPLRDAFEACVRDGVCGWSAGACARHPCAAACTQAVCVSPCVWGGGGATPGCRGIPPPIGCAAIGGRAECLAAACEWNVGAAACTDARPCAETPAEGGCTERRDACRWDGAACVDNTCEYSDEVACRETPACAWTGGGGCELLPALCRDRSLPLCEAAGETCKLAGGACVVNPGHAVSCTPLSGGGVCCECKGSWTGAQCDECDLVLTAAGTCEPCTRQQTCSDHGTCSASGVCACDSGWSGAECDVSFCTPRGPAWYTLYPNQPLAGVEFTIVVHGCFHDEYSAKLLKVVDGAVDCNQNVAASCTIDGGGAEVPTATLKGVCANGVSVEGVFVEAAGQELLVRVTTEGGAGSRTLQVCGVVDAGGRGGWTRLATHHRTGGRASSFEVSAAAGSDAGAVASAGAAGEPESGACGFPAAAAAVLFFGMLAALGVCAALVRGSLAERARVRAAAAEEGTRRLKLYLFAHGMDLDQLLSDESDATGNGNSRSQVTSIDGQSLLAARSDLIVRLGI
ncbi:hypothetical protein DIPPA_31362 [Diplonema papillatum]|nr:hypothetical protein DIPPA_31362 [Diplonema papillatum]